MTTTVNQTATKAAILCVRLGNVTQDLHKRLDDVYFTAEQQAANYTQDAADDKTVKLLNSIEQLISLLEDIT